MKLSHNHKDLLYELVKTNFKLRYNNSILGLIWVLIKPLAVFTILYFVWTAFRGSTEPNYQVNLLLGIMLFNFVNEAIMFGMNGLLDKSHIILKVNFPREIAVLSSMLMAVINLIINLVIFGIFSLFNPIAVTLGSFLWFIFIIVSITIFIYGIDLFLSILLIKLRDLQNIFELFFQLLFWATPIFYTLGNLPGQINTGEGQTFGNLVSLNPLGWIITSARQALIGGNIGNIDILNSEISSFYLIVFLFLFGCVLTILGRIFFKHKVKEIAEFF